jgi:hypothetical protein
MKNGISSIFVVGLLILIVLGCGELRRNASRDDTPDFEISVEQLVKEFKDNPTSADFKYSGRTLSLTGVVNQKILGSTLVFKTDHRRDGFAVQCFFDKDGADSYKKIRNGQEVTMLGLCKGRDSNDGPLMITQCILR